MRPPRSVYMRLPPAPATSTGSALAILKPTTKYAAVQAVELGLAVPGAARLAGPWLWRLPEASETSSLARLVGLQMLLVPVARAATFVQLLDDVSAHVALPQDCRWALTYSAHGRRARAAAGASPRATDYLCAVAQRLGGAPALGAAGATELVLLRTPRLWCAASDSCTGRLMAAADLRLCSPWQVPGGGDGGACGGG